MVLTNSTCTYIKILCINRINKFISSGFAFTIAKEYIFRLKFCLFNILDSPAFTCGITIYEIKAYRGKITLCSQADICKLSELIAANSISILLYCIYCRKGGELSFFQKIFTKRKTVYFPNWRYTVFFFKHLAVYRAVEEQNVSTIKTQFQSPCGE